jgi:hypothetical protein
MNATAASRTIIGVPGHWKDRSDIVNAIVKNSGGYLFAGAIMMHIDSKVRFQVDIYEHDDKLANAFRVAGSERLSEELLKEIEEHTFCIYLVGEGGSIELAHQFLKAGEALLNCGGLAIKIESAGVAHSPSDWRHFAAAASEHPAAYLSAFVTYVGKSGGYYSCGMHNLGYPDCVVEAAIDPPAAANLMHHFLHYLLTESPALESGETFSISANAPHYRLAKEECSMFDQDDSFYNPNGIWKLVPA